ncbi:hypothetical protein GXW83_08620 [Streptacidiphilus sp. PB12-B1b]|uniref:hypothetical protein n=1 Tax=Streptacidiphilus sp. PB12-B1b TaxID=2705012 RepID=UPI0015F8B69B|nr:hypothetical protein [Streptacidiphilus sp. PB12-B1b]QMU75794.1 hypothetical protein GXW83_08620 [Streptacidiphilus sp. PB12-B1b]
MNRPGIRMAATVAVAAMALGVAAPMASATEAAHARSTRAAAVSVSVPQIVEAGLDDRLAALPADRTTAQVVAAMYPGDTAAQQLVLANIAPAAVTGQHMVRPMSFWGTAWKYTKCVAAVGAAFIPAGKAYKAIKGLGGVTKAAELLIKAGGVAEFKQAAGNAALNILGVSAIQSNCF